MINQPQEDIALPENLKRAIEKSLNKIQLDNNYLKCCKNV